MSGEAEVGCQCGHRHHRHAARRKEPTPRSLTIHAAAISIRVGGAVDRRRAAGYASRVGRIAAWVLGVLVAASALPSLGDGRVGLLRGMAYGVVVTGGPARVRLPGFTTATAVDSLAFDRLLQVAPGEQALASWSPSARSLVVVAADGAERARISGASGAFRFSPGGDRLAFAGDRGVEILELAGGKRSVLTPLMAVEDLAWTSTGVVVLHGPAARRAITLLGPTGERRALAAAGPVQAFAAAGVHVVWAAGGALFDVDVSAPAGQPTRAALAEKPVELLTISPDGSRALFATAGHVYLRDGASAPGVIADAADVHSLSFAADGKLFLWASAHGGEVVAGDKRQPLPRKTSSARFRRRGAGVLLTDADGLHLWNPDGGALERLAGLADEDGRELAGDAMGSFALVLYLRTPPAVKKQMAPEIPLP